MAIPALISRQMIGPVSLVPGRLLRLALAGLVFAVIAGIVPGTYPYLRLFLVSAGCILLVMAGLVWFLSWNGRHRLRKVWRRIDDLMARDAAPVFVTDLGGKIRYQNPAALDYFAAPGEQALLLGLGHIFADPAAELRRLQACALSQGAVRKDVQTRQGLVRLTAHCIDKGAVLWRIEEVIPRPAHSPATEDLGLPMLVADAGDAVVFANQALRRLTGVHPQTLDQVFAHLPLRSGGMAELITAAGPQRLLVAEVAAEAGRREIYLLPAAQNTEDAAGFEDLPVALLRLASDGMVLAANRLARDLLRVPAGEVALHDLVEGLGRPLGDWISDVMAGRVLPRLEFLRARRPEEEIFLQVSLRRVMVEGQPGLVAVLIDATEHKTLEAQFIQSQKMQAIGQLAGGVAHDFNNLLTAISGHCDLLLLRHDRNDPDYADLVQIHQNTNRAAYLVGQLLAFSRKQTLQPEMIDLREALADLTHLLNRLVGEKIVLTLKHEDRMQPIRADRRQFEQVMMNLVVNARDAMPMGGEIRVSTEMRVLTEPLLRDRATVPAGPYMLVHVRDEGVGITPDKLPKIFEPFFTTKRVGEGTGLGLSMVYGIVKQTGGFIFVDSVVGKGTTFTLYFPAHDDVAVPAPAPDLAPVALPQGKGVVLLVEDEPPVRIFAARALRMRGYTVLEAESAEEALQMLDDPALHVDVFVTDVIMPGMDGPSWVREALQKRPDVKVIFVSGYAEDSFAEARRRTPNAVFLPKPFSLSQLTSIVQSQMR